MQNNVVQFQVVKFVNRVLSDYPAARERLTVHAGKVISSQVGPLESHMRITGAGEMELVGETGAGTPPSDVSFIVPLALLPGLATKDPAALSQIVFTGDSELAATLSDIARNVDWDIEGDLSRVFGDVLAHRLVTSAHQLHEWRADAGQRITANVAEYLTEERRAFITSRELETLSLNTESLRDDIARLEARVANITT